MDKEVEVEVAEAYPVYIAYYSQEEAIVDLGKEVVVVEDAAALADREDKEASASGDYEDTEVAWLLIG